MHFSYTSNEKITIEGIKDQAAGTFDVSGCIKWLSDAMPVTINGDRTSLLREAILFDKTTDIPITVWEDHFQNIDEYTWYHFTRLNLKNYFGQKLSTTKSTSITKEDTDTPIPQLNDTEIDHYVNQTNSFQKKEEILCCPEISHVSLEIYFACTNKECKRQVTKLPGKKIVTCIYCSRAMKSQKCDKMMNITLSFDTIDLQLSQEIISKFLDLDVMQMCSNDMDKLKETILFLENIDFTYNIKTNNIVNMTKH